jgi:transcriptional regulator with XRE-family HTH domain
MEYAVVAAELLRALRGKRSQVALARRLGYRSNVVYTWESGGGAPTAARTFELAARVGVDPATAVTRFYGRRPDWLDQHALTTAQGVAALLRDLRGRQPLRALAAATGRNRYALARWLDAATEPRLPDFLRLVEATSRRLLDFLGAFVDLERIPSVAEAGRRVTAARQLAREAPWSHAVLRALELAGYAALPRHEPGWIAGQVGISTEEEERCLRALEGAGQIVWCEERWRPQGAAVIDLRRDAEATRELASWCATLGTARLEAGDPGAFAFNVFTVSSADLGRLRQLQREHFAQLRAIVAASEPAERLVVANLQLFELGGE